MQVNSISRIDLIFPCGTSYNIRPLQHPVYLPYPSPIAFIWHDSHLCPITPELINWLERDFKPLFNYDPLKWFASVGTCSPELQPYLKDFHALSNKTNNNL